MYSSFRLLWRLLQPRPCNRAQVWLPRAHKRGARDRLLDRGLGRGHRLHLRLSVGEERLLLQVIKVPKNLIYKCFYKYLANFRGASAEKKSQ